MRLSSRFSVLISFSFVVAAVAIATLPHFAQAAKSGVPQSIAFSCVAKSAGAGFDLSISADGAASAKLDQAGKTYTCPLKIQKLTDQRHARVPFVGVTLSRQAACTPALPEKFQKSLRGDFALNLVKSGRKPASNVSFLSKTDDASCTPTNFRVADFNALIKRYKTKR